MQVPNYRILHEIGRGPNAVVYLALQEAKQRRVALKIIELPDSKASGFAAQYKSELHGMKLKIQQTARLKHRNIVRIYGAGLCDGGYFIAMEYLEGGNLAQRIERGMTREYVLDIGAEIGAALGYCHGLKVWHHNLKPSNVLFRADGTVVISDFSIPRLDRKTALTSVQEPAGLYYVSPELARGANADFHSDQYSLGIILYACLTGQVPFRADNAYAVYVLHSKAPVPPLAAKLQLFQPLLERLLAKQPETRFNDPDELLEALQKLKNRSSLAPRALYAKRVLGWGVGLTAVAALSLAIAFWFPLHTTKSDRSANREAVIINLEPAPDPIEPPSESNTVLTGEPLSEAEMAVLTHHEIKIGTWLDSDPDTAETATTVNPATAEPAPPSSDTGSGRSPQSAPAAAAGVQAKDIATLLIRAGQHFRAGRLTAPYEQSAYYAYRRVLELDPGNRAGRAGLQRIASKYMQIAVEEKRRGRLLASLDNTELGLTVFPEHKGLSLLHTVLQELIRSQPEKAEKTQ